MNLPQHRMLGDLIWKSGSFALKRRRAAIPSRIETVVLDIDHTLIHQLSAYASLEKMLGPREARREFEQQKAEVKSGKKSFLQVKQWGHQIQREHNWTKGDWSGLADRLFRAWRDEGLIQGVAGAQRQRPDLKIILTTGTSDVFGRRLAQLLHTHYNLRVDHVVGSQQTFDRKGRVQSLVRFVGDQSRTIPAIEKIPAIQETFPTFDPKTTLAISDADPNLLRKVGIGLLIPTSKGKDPASWISQKFKLYDLPSKHGAIRREFVREIILRPREAMREYAARVQTPLGETDQFSRRIIRERKEHLRH